MQRHGYSRLLDLERLLYLLRLLSRFPGLVTSDPVNAAERLRYQQAEAIDTAILEHRRVVLERFSTVAGFPDSPVGELRVWPLQLIFHTIGWYLLYEEDAVARPHGLIRTERLDRLALRRSESRNCRSDDEHRQADERAGGLLHLSGGIYCGDDLSEQLALAGASAKTRARRLLPCARSTRTRPAPSLPPTALLKWQARQARQRKRSRR